VATIVQETGAGLSNSNSYITEAELTTYATDRGITISGTNAVLIIQAMDYIEQQNFQGDKYTEAQALQWPRSSVVVDNYHIDVDAIPELLKDAQAEVCLGIDAGDNPLASVSRETRREKVGGIEVEYATAASAQTYLKAAAYKLKKLLKYGGALQVIRA